MSIKALQDYTYVSKYARYNNGKKEEKRGTNQLIVFVICIFKSTQIELNFSQI